MGIRKRKRILLVRLDAIGDFILWLDAAAALRQLYPRDTCRVTLLANRDWSELASHLPWWDEVLPLHRHMFRERRSAHRLSLFCRIASRRFDIALQPTFSREKQFGDTVIRWSRAAQRIGSVGDLSNISAEDRRQADSWYTHLVPAAAGPMWEVERNAEFMRQIGAPRFRGRLPLLPELEAERSIADAADSGYVVLVPGARHAIKRWPPAGFAEIARRIHAVCGARPVVLCGNTSENPVGDEIAASPGVSVTNLVGKTSLIQTLALLRRAALVVSNDTMAVHLAAAAGTPVVCIAGGGHPGRFVPYPGDRGSAAPVYTVTRPMDCYGCSWDCRHPRSDAAPAPCVDGISADAVWAAILRVLDCREPRSTQTGPPGTLPQPGGSSSATT